LSSKGGDHFSETRPYVIGAVFLLLAAYALYNATPYFDVSADKLAKWYPDFPNADKITIEQLLRMRSGIVDPPSSPKKVGRSIRQRNGELALATARFMPIRVGDRLGWMAPGSSRRGCGAGRALDEAHLDLERDDQGCKPYDGRAIRHEQREP
jgi:hypothetical protein